MIEFGWLVVQLTVFCYAPLQGGGKLEALAAEFAVLLFGRFDLALERSAADFCEFCDRSTPVWGENTSK
jgi:hypothetical protein